jgi:hypothetical protein
VPCHSELFSQLLDLCSPLLLLCGASVRTRALSGLIRPTLLLLLLLRAGTGIKSCDRTSESIVAKCKAVESDQ